MNYYYYYFFLIREFKPELNTQSVSIRANVFTCYNAYLLYFFAFILRFIYSYIHKYFTAFHTEILT